MFSISRGTGFQMTFKNGITLSVQFGSEAYCDNRNVQSVSVFPEPTTPVISKNAEIAVWRGTGGVDGELLSQLLGEDVGDNVKGWLTVDEVAGVIAKILAMD